MHSECNAIESFPNHLSPYPFPLEKLSSTKLFPGAKKVQDRWTGGQIIGLYNYYHGLKTSASLIVKDCCYVGVLARGGSVCVCVCVPLSMAFRAFVHGNPNLVPITGGIPF